MSSYQSHTIKLIPFRFERTGKISFRTFLITCCCFFFFLANPNQYLSRVGSNVNYIINGLVMVTETKFETVLSLSGSIQNVNMLKRVETNFKKILKTKNKVFL